MNFSNKPSSLCATSAILCFILASNCSAQMVATASSDKVNGPVDFLRQPFEWDSLIGCAGAPREGLCLDVHPFCEHLKLGESIKLLLSLQNVSDKQVAVPICPGDLPFAFIRDEHGKPVAMTMEGQLRKSRAPRFVIDYPRLKVRNVHMLEPGEANAYVLQLETLYVLRSPGHYDALALDSSLTQCVGKPVSFSIGVDVAVPEEHGWYFVNNNPTIHGVSYGPHKPTDSDWSGIAALAGMPRESVILKAMMSPVTPGILIVSVYCSNIDEKQEIAAPNSASNAAKYWLLVRDSMGKPVPMIGHELEPDKSRINEISNDARTIKLHPGMAIGAAIPITRMFDMKKPGEYSILAVLPASDGAGPVWVAGPVKYQVGIKRPSDKQK